ncbi:MSHA pilin protein mshA [Vibrio ishigakensis]|uniref:MSHA pilin protein mshA n=1 Tax=Vibrio ishigakensis TaxID=1481914 RepID=A0A0B8PIR5_9VIBR|nr:MSHA pilin protein mshA [Vibrio ishigakensis]
MAGAGSIVYGKAAIEGVERLDYNDDATAAQLEDETELQFGYPRATEDGIVKVVQGLEDTNEWSWVQASGATSIVATLASSAGADEGEITGTECFVTYNEAENSASTPSIVVTNTGC